MIRKILLKEGVFYYITAALTLCIICLALAPFFNLHVNFWTSSISTILIFIFAIFHSIIKKGTKNTIIFVIISTIISFIAEYIGVNHGYIFGGYSYSMDLGVKILGVPLLVIIMWSALIYVVYSLSEHILGFRLTKDLSKLDRFYLSFSSSIVASLAAVAWDFVLDPLAVNSGWWTWEGTSAYFGIPAANFIGWLIVVFLSVFLFKMFFEHEHLETETRYDYAPALAYLLLYVGIVAMAIDIKQPIFILIGFITMFSFISIILVRYFVVGDKAPALFRNSKKRF